MTFATASVTSVVAARCRTSGKMPSSGVIVVPGKMGTTTRSAAVTAGTAPRNTVDAATRTATRRRPSPLESGFPGKSRAQSLALAPELQEAPVIDFNSMLPVTRDSTLGKRNRQSQTACAPPSAILFPIESTSITARARPIETSAARIFVIDDDDQIRRLLQRLLTPAGYAVELFPTADEGLARIRADSPDLVLLDLHLPDRSGHEVLEAIRADPATRLLPVVMLTGMATASEKMRAQSLGVTDFIPKPFSQEELLPRVRALVMLKLFADEHEHAEHVILTLAKTIDARDPYTAGHSGRVAEYADNLAARMGLDAGARNDMRRGALFHDLGKIVIPDAVLRKPGALTPEERAIIEEHPVVGNDLLSPMKTMRKTLPVVYHHHERLDGSGYPEGISGTAIPMSVRIVTVADIFDALTTDRAYRGALRVETAFEILAEGVQKGWWDPDVVDLMRGIVDESGLSASGLRAGPGAA